MEHVPAFYIRMDVEQTELLTQFVHEDDAETGHDNISPDPHLSTGVFDEQGAGDNAIDVSGFSFLKDLCSIYLLSIHNDKQIAYNLCREALGG